MALPKVDTARLSQAIKTARLVLRQFREERREAVKQYVGHHWGEWGTAEKRPINLLGLYVGIMTQNLVAKEPRVMLSTFKREERAVVSAMQSWANRQVVDMDLAGSLQRWVMDALFSVGIMKVGLSTPADAAMSGWNMPAGTPFAETIDLDDFVFDVHARDFKQVSFVGHRYRVPRDTLKDRMYTRGARDLPTSEETAYNQEGDERLTAAGRLPYAQNDEEFEDMVDLWEIYIPRKRLILTYGDSIAVGGSDAGPIRTQEWLGPDAGPYHFLGYVTVPGNAMPKGTVQDLIDLDKAVNEIFRKQIRQADRQKEVLGVSAGATEDGERVLKTSDGEAFKCDNPKDLQVMGFGGPNQQNFALGTSLIDRFSWLAGNLDIMGGLSPQSKTATQDKLLSQNASAAIADKQSVTVRGVACVIRALCWYWWKDPFQTMRSRHSLPGMPEMSIERKVTPMQRQGIKFEDLEVDVDPYSMRHQTPQEKVQAINSVVQQLQPLMPLAQQQGIMLDLNALVDKLAKYLDLPELAEILTVQEPPQQEAGSEPQQPGQPAETTRNYTRESQVVPPAMGARMGMAPQMMKPNGQANGMPAPGGAG